MTTGESVGDDVGVVVFGYSFAHKKTQDVLLRLFLEDIPVSAVLAADPVELKIPPSTVRSKIRHVGMVEPSRVAGSVGARYVNLPHSGPEVLELLEELEPDLGVIGGARILPPEVIDRFRVGIINMHPGLIPEVRGLDALLWSVLNDVPPGVTAHLIDRHVDAGRIILRREIPVREGDTVLDLSERLYDVQLDMLAPAVRKGLDAAGSDELVRVDPDGPYNSKMPPELEREAMEKVPEYVRRKSAGAVRG